MKTHLYILAAFLLLGTFGLDAQSADPVLFTVDNKPVHVSEFDYIYKKNNGKNANYSDQSLREYMDLYIKFKLKVAKAKSLQLDTIKALQTELAGYRKQLSNAYLVDKEVTNFLVDQAFERKQKDIKVSHILITVDPQASRDTEAQILEKVYHIKEKLNNGAPFEDMAATLSDDKASAERKGLLGWLTAILPSGFYEFENAIYNTKVGEISQPVKSRLGYHIIRVDEIREARGEMEVAHILVRKAKDGKEVVNAKEMIDSLHQRLIKGDSFTKVAKEFSDDKNTANKGGFLGYFGIGLYDPRFEEAAFALQNDDDFSGPVESPIGWHIIKRIGKKDYTNETKMKSAIKNQISKNDRFDIARSNKIQDILKEANFTEDKKVLSHFIDSLSTGFYSYKWQVPSLPAKNLFSLENFASYSINDFGAYCKKNTRRRAQFSKNTPLREAATTMYKEYIDEKALQYEESNLEQKYPEFKALMREYAEGILLFEVTKENVWDKAQSDTVGLKKFYNENKENYSWEERARISMYKVKSSDKDFLQKISKMIEKSGADFTINTTNKDSKEVIEREVRTLEKSSELIKDMKWKLGEVKIDINQVSNESQILRIEELMKPAQKSLKEARGYIIADYQDQLEQIWVQSLSEEFVVNVKEKVLKSLIKS